MQFRLLTKDEIDVRVGTANDKGVSLLLYKDARCDQNILDETVGPFNWQRHRIRSRGRASTGASAESYTRLRSCGSGSRM